MSKLIYSAITSLDGYVADAAGKFDWAEPDEEVHRFVFELVDRGAVTGLVDSLEAAGLVRRQPHPEDRRVSLVELTEKGVSVLDDLLPDHLRGEEEMLAALTEEEQQTLLELLEKVQARLGGMPF